MRDLAVLYVQTLFATQPNQPTHFLLVRHPPLSPYPPVLRRPATWEEAKKQLGDANFMMKLKEFDKDKLDDGLLKKIAKITINPDFTPESVGKVCRGI